MIQEIKGGKKIIELIEKIKNNNEKLIIEEVYDSKNFYNNFRDIIKFK